MRNFGKRFGRFLLQAVLVLLAAEVVAFALCLGVQWVEFRKFDKASPSPRLRTFASHTGIFYQDQAAKFVYRPDPLLTYRFRPGVHFHNVEYPDQHVENKIWVSRANGFVKNNSDPRDSEAVRKGSPLVVFTGGSTVAGDDISRNEHTIPSRLEAWLRKRCADAGTPAAELRVLNAGVPGYTATQEVSLFLYDLAFYEPAAWIQLSGVNEPWHMGMLSGSTELHFNKVTRNYPLPDPPAASPFFPALQKLVQHWAPLAFGYRSTAGQPWDRERPDQVGSTAARFLKMIVEGSGAAAALEVPHFFFLQPTMALDRDWDHVKDQLSRFPGMEKYWSNAEAFYGEVRPSLALYRKRFPRWFDLTGIFHGLNTAEVYYGTRHYTDEGARRIAEEIGARVWPELRPKICPSSKPRAGTRPR